MLFVALTLILSVFNYSVLILPGQNEHFVFKLPPTISEF